MQGGILFATSDIAECGVERRITNPLHAIHNRCPPQPTHQILPTARKASFSPKSPSFPATNHALGVYPIWASEKIAEHDALSLREI